MRDVDERGGWRPKKAEDIYVQTTGLQSQWTGYSGVAVFVNPLILFDVVDKVAEMTYQSITLRILETTVTFIYMSPGATQEDEQNILAWITKMNRGQYIVMRDPDVWPRIWEKTKWSRSKIHAMGWGRRVENWLPKRSELHNQTRGKHAGHSYDERDTRAQTYCSHTKDTEHEWSQADHDDDKAK